MYITYDNNTKYLVYTSFLFLLSSILSFFYNSIYSTLIIFLLFLSSINHWNNPNNKIIKIIDLFIVKIIGILYVIKSFYKEEFYRVFATNIAISIIIFYMIEHILDFYKNNQWVIFHMALHIYASYVFILFLFV